MKTEGIEDPVAGEGQNSMTSTEIDIFEFSQRGEEVPHAPAYRVRIDGEVFRIETPTPKGELLLGKVGRRPCAFELIEEFVHGKNDIVEPEEEVDLRGIFANIADCAAECGFLVPARLERDGVQFAISTGGENPRRAAEVRRDLEEAIGDRRSAFSRGLRKLKADS